MPIEIPPTFFPDIDRLIIKLIWKYQEKPKHSWRRKKEQNWRSQFSQF